MLIDRKRRGSKKVEGVRGSKETHTTAELPFPEPPSGVADARRLRPTPALAAEPEIAALDHACKPATLRSQRARAARKAGIVAHAQVPVTAALVDALIEARPPYLSHCDRRNKRAIAAAVAAWWKAAHGL